MTRVDANDLRLAVYRPFAGTGRASGIDGLARRSGAPVGDPVVGRLRHAWYVDPSVSACRSGPADPEPTLTPP